MEGSALGIVVNGVLISSAEINAEYQHQRVGNPRSVAYAAARALVIRELLIQRAVELGLSQRAEAIQNSDAIIDDLLAQEIKTPLADQETCLRYYNHNRPKFVTSPIFDVSHILYIAALNRPDQRQWAKNRAEESLLRLRSAPTLFEQIARSDSACSSAAQGGRLGQIIRGQTTPAFEEALLQMEAGDLTTQPVATEVGYHIIKVHDKANGKQLPFETVKAWIAESLHARSWNRAFQQYITLLAGRSQMSGFTFEETMQFLM